METTTITATTRGPHSGLEADIWQYDHIWSKNKTRWKIVVVALCPTGDEEDYERRGKYTMIILVWSPYFSHLISSSITVTL